jgi:RecA-family ATPase
MKGMKIKTYNQLQKFDDSNKWLIQGLILQSGLVTLVASPKSSKSFCSLEIAVAIASGSKCMNKFEVSKVTRVLYYGAEDAEGIIHERLSGFLKARNLTELNNLGILTADSGVRIDTTQGLADLIAQIESFNKPSLLILDCFYAISRIHESDAGSVIDVLENLSKIRTEYKCAVLLVHHTSKDSDSKKVGSRIRGSSVFHGFFETILGLRKDANGNIFLDVEHRASESKSNIAISLKSEESGITYSVNETHPFEYVSSNDTPITSDEQAILSALRCRIPTTLTDVCKTTGLNAVAVRNTIYRLIKQRMITWNKNGYVKTGVLQ